MRVAIHEFTTYNKTTRIKMDLPNIEPIVWKKPEPTRQTLTAPKTVTSQLHYAPLSTREDVRRDYIGADGILHIHYPGIPELN